MNKTVIGITFQAGGRCYFFLTCGIYDVSNFTENDFVRFATPFVESYKIARGISAKTEWIA